MAKAHYIGVDGVARKVKQPYIGVDGVARKVKAGYVGVDGVARQFFAGGSNLGAVPVGTSVYLNVSGVATEFLVVHQGNPDSSIYDASCDGTWLLMKNAYTSGAWNTYANGHFVVSGESAWNRYDLSIAHNYLNSTFLGLLDTAVQSAIKQVKIPYAQYAYINPTVFSGANGLSAKLFLLGGSEIGWSASTLSQFVDDGTCLSYFEGMATADSARCAYLANGDPITWWTRSPNGGGNASVYAVIASNEGASSDKGGPVSASADHTAYGYRPALILPSDITIDDNFNVVA